MKAFRLVGALGLCMAVLLAMVISVRSSLNSLDQPAIEIVYLWSAAKSCTEVHVLTPASWIPIAEGILQPGDCIVSVAGESIDSPAMIAKLKPLVDLPLGSRMVPVRIQREGQAPFNELVPAIKMTYYRIFQIYFTLFITAMILWILGLIIFLTNHRLEQNVIFAQALWCIALCVLGSMHRLPTMGQYFTLLTVLIPMPLVGALLFHLAWVFPVPTSRKLVKYSLYPLAFYSAWIHTQVIMHIGSGLPWVPLLARRAGLINGFLIFSGFVMLLWRWRYFLYRQSVQAHLNGMCQAR
ncbi:hypothetical protein [Herpetosiphon llansteffanensis]|uniref:hypothetical protein n=1 Tax=Herpetosiphon llansteffanensis TaxID=2094568 RepID=UPI000D7BA908|nr:hypothetical protein [Herpetosiphon llansteffanensis]